MSKKTARRKARRESVAATPSPVVGSTPGRSSPSGSSPSGSTSSRTYEFKPDYSYVIKDLRRIGTLAGIFMSILVVLSFFLR
jgi:hypothetical protein